MHLYGRLSDRELLLCILERINRMAENETRLIADVDTLSALLTNQLQAAQDLRDQLAALQANSDNDADLAAPLAKLDAMIASITPATPQPAPDPATGLASTSATASGADAGGADASATGASTSGDAAAATDQTGAGSSAFTNGEPTAE